MTYRWYSYLGHSCLAASVHISNGRCIEKMEIHYNFVAPSKEYVALAQECHQLIVTIFRLTRVEKIFRDTTRTCEIVKFYSLP